MVLFVTAGLLATLFAFLSQYEGKERFIFVSLAIIAFIMGFQDSIGNDYPGYIQHFIDIKNGRLDPTLMRSDNRMNEVEVGWYYINRFVGFFTDTFQIVSFIVGCAVSLAIYTLLKYVPKNSRWLAILFFYFNPALMIWMMSGLRQSMAIALFTIAIVLMIEKKWKPSILLIAAAFTLHDSMITGSLFALILFIPYAKLLEKKTLVVVSFTLFFMFAYTSQQLFQDFLKDITSGFEDEYTTLSYMSEFENNEYSLLNILMRFLFFIPALYSFVYSEYKGNPLLLYTLIFIPLLIIFGTTTLARITFYIMLFQIPAVCMSYNALKNLGILHIVFGVYIIYFCIRMFTNSLIDPQFMRYLDYKTIFF